MLECARCEVNRHMELHDVIIVFKRSGRAGKRWQDAAQKLFRHLESEYPKAEMFTKDRDRP